MLPRPTSAEENEVLRALLTCFVSRMCLAGDTLVAVSEELKTVPGLPPETLGRLAAIIDAHNAQAAAIDQLARPYLQQFGSLQWQAAGGPANKLKL